MLDMFLKGGALMWPILLCSVLALTIALKKSLQFQGVLKELSCEIDMILTKKPEYLVPVLQAIDDGRNENSKVGY
jgi:biopolymer transport protein ExbB